MSYRLLIYQRAKEDLIEHYAHIAADEPNTAESFLVASQKLFDHLTTFPQMGRLWNTSDRELQQIRIMPIAGFKNYLVFHRVINYEIHIISIIHGARDLPILLNYLEKHSSSN